MNEKKFAFIVAVNNEQYFRECTYYIEHLDVPEGYEVETLAVREADSMCAAYNLAMTGSEAKFKVYLHQDVFIRNEHFLHELLRIFNSDASIGMIGMLGGNEMPQTGVAYLAWDVGLVDWRDADMAYILSGQPAMREDTVVEAVDGLLIATQYDIPWREDLFKNFDFYDISESFEMRKRGYRIVVPFQETPWVIHDSSFAKLSHYDHDCKVCLSEYRDYLYAENGFSLEYHSEWEELSSILAGQLKQLITNGNWDAVCETIAEYRQGKMKDSTLEMIGIMSDIWQIESKKTGVCGLFHGLDSYEQVYERYAEVRFLLRRMELGMPEEAYQDVLEMMEKDMLSYEVLMIFLVHAVIDKRSVLTKVRDIYLRRNRYREAEAVTRLLKRLGTEKTLPVTYTKKVMQKKIEEKS